MTAPDLKPCPFCGGDAEQDYQQPYRSIVAAKLGKACAIYCMSCSANMTVCHEDHEGVSPDDLMAELVATWNTRTPDPAAIREAVAAICAEDDDFVGIGKSAYDKADRILALIEKEPKG